MQPFTDMNRNMGMVMKIVERNIVDIGYRIIKILSQTDIRM
jgi:hypothetical protein